MSFRPDTCLFTQFTVDADSGTPQVIVANDVLNILGDGAHLTTVVSATDTVTISYDLCSALQDFTSSGVIPAGWEVIATDGADCARYELPIYSVDDTSCIDLTITGGVLTADPIISPDAGNGVECRANGLWSPAATSISVSDTDCVNLTLTGTGTPGDPFVLSADPIVDPAADNTITCTVDGLYVPSYTLTVTDSDCIDVTLTGDGSTATPWNVSVDVVLSADAGNAVECRADGLYVSGVGISVTDTDCIDLTLTGTGAPGDPFVLNANPIIAATAGNVLTCTVDGLYVPTDSFTFNTATSVFTHTAADGTVVSGVVVSGNAGNLITIGTDGGAFLNCEIIQDCVGASIAAGCGLTYDDANDLVTVDTAALAGTASVTSLQPGPGSCDLQVLVDDTTVKRNVDGELYVDVCELLDVATTRTTGRLLIASDDPDCKPELLEGTDCPFDVLHSTGDGSTVEWRKPRTYVPVTTVTADYAATEDDEMILVDASAGPVEVTLPACNPCGSNVYTVKKIDSSANAVTVVGDGGALIDGSASASFSCQYSSYDYVCDGTDWWIR